MYAVLCPSSDLSHIYIFFQIANLKGWKQIRNIEEIAKLCVIAMENNPRMVENYKKGKTKVLYALAGEVAKHSDQKANMAMVVDALTELLKK